jgi:sporulation protein YlmC with PRC-barrel domain
MATTSVTRRGNDYDNSPSCFQDVTGKKVFTEKGVYLGVVEDIRISFAEDRAKSIALVDINEQIDKQIKSNKGIILQYSSVKSVNDVVVTYDILPLDTAKASQQK